MHHGHRLTARALCALLACFWVSPGSTQDALSIKLKAASCNACHGPDGRSQAGIPPLAGRPGEALLQAMRDLRSGKRPSFVMAQLLNGYSDEELAALAAEFSRQPPADGSK